MWCYVGLKQWQLSYKWDKPGIWNLRTRDFFTTCEMIPKGDDPWWSSTPSRPKQFILAGGFKCRKWRFHIKWWVFGSPWGLSHVQKVLEWRILDMHPAPGWHGPRNLSRSFLGQDQVQSMHVSGTWTSRIARDEGTQEKSKVIQNSQYLKAPI